MVGFLPADESGRDVRTADIYSCCAGSLTDCELDGGMMYIPFYEK